MIRFVVGFAAGVFASGAVASWAAWRDLERGLHRLSAEAEYLRSMAVRR